MLNYQCFEKLAMSGDSEKSEAVRNYFIKIREFITENQAIIYQSIENKEELHKYSGYDSIYFFAADDRKPDFIKVGRTNDIVKRLKTYNTGRIKGSRIKIFCFSKKSKINRKMYKIINKK